MKITIRFSQQTHQLRMNGDYIPVLPHADDRCGCCMKEKLFIGKYRAILCQIEGNLSLHRSIENEVFCSTDKVSSGLAKAGSS